MKAFPLFLLAFTLLFTGNPLRAASIASKSLVKSKQGNIFNAGRSIYNPAVLGFNTKTWSISFEQVSLDYDIPATLDIMQFDVTYKQENLFYNIRTYTMEFPFANVYKDAVSLSVGWANADFSVAAYLQNAEDQDFRDDDFMGFGVVMAIGENAFLGFHSDTGPVGIGAPPTRQLCRSVAIAYRVERDFRVEYSVNIDINNYGDESKMNVFEIEYQWEDLVFGINAASMIEVAATTAMTDISVAYVPEDSDFNISLGILDVSDPGLTGGMVFSIGTLF